ncbi:MAG: alpha/beta hydrolase [Crocinitomicaceae bacterium]
MNLRIIIFTVLFLFFSSQIFAQNSQTKSPIAIGERVEIKSTILKENRVLNIYLPAGYSNDSLNGYPVIYLLDGSMNEDFLHISGLVQFGSFSWIKMIPQSIVVGISNIDRKKDFTFPSTIKRDNKNFPTTGSSSSFISFIEQELQPFIDSNYNTSSVKTIIGQSLGGLLATEILLTKPHLFDNFIIISPSLWWDKESLLKKEPSKFQSKKSIYIGVGKEGKVMERTAKELYDKLKKSKQENDDLYFEFFEKQDHGDVLHLAVYNAFDKIFRAE